MAPEIIRRKEALAQGLVRHYTGKPCKYRHVAERFVASGTCCVCAALILRKRYNDNPDHGRARAREWRSLNKEKARTACLRYSKEHPEKRKTAVNRWRRANPDKVREINRRGSRVYAQKHPAAVAESKRKWASVPENRVARAATIRAWQKANPEKVRAAVRNRRAKIAGSPGTHTADDLAEILVAQGNRCAYCRVDLKRTKKHVDHITPLALGGSNGRANLQYLCRRCNQTKNARDPIDHARSLGLLL